MTLRPSECSHDPCPRVNRNRRRAPTLERRWFFDRNRPAGSTTRRQFTGHRALRADL